MKRIFSSLNNILGAILALILVQMINFVALRNPVRWNLSERNYYTLSEKTTHLLDELTTRIDVTVFFQEEHKLYHDIENLIEEYQHHSRNIHVQWIDPARDRAQTEKLAAKYGLTDAQVVVFDMDGKSKVVRQQDVADFQMVQNRKEPIISAFKGEQAFSSAIQGLMQEEVPKVYFLDGHGERQVTDFDQRSGFSTIAAVMLRDNLEVAELMLGGEKNNVPDDAAVLIIAAPAKVLNPIEVEMIEEYLSRSGRVMILLDALKETGLEPMLRRWGVGLRNDFVIDPENTLRGSDVHVRRYTDHPISINLQSMVQFILPRSIEPLITSGGKDRPEVIPLAQTSEQSWSEMNVNASEARFDVDVDVPGPIDLAVAVERGAAAEMLDVQIQPSRMVVIGDSDFVANGSMVGGNQDLYMSALNWLLDREVLMAIAPKPIEEVKISLTRKQLNTQIWINVIGIPSIAIAAGLITWLRRRK